MRYEAEIRIYDVLDQIWIRARVWDTEGQDPPCATPIIELSDSIAGEGVDHPRPWLRDALIALLESL